MVAADSAAARAVSCASTVCVAMFTNIATHAIGPTRAQAPITVAAPSR
jgi:hypothetical protein